MKKNKYVIYGLMVNNKGQRVITETLQKDYCKLLALVRWFRNHKSQKLLKAFRG